MTEAAEGERDNFGRSSFEVCKTSSLFASFLYYFLLFLPSKVFIDNHQSTSSNFSAAFMIHFSKRFDFLSPFFSLSFVEFIQVGEQLHGSSRALYTPTVCTLLSWSLSSFPIIRLSRRRRFLQHGRDVLSSHHHIPVVYPVHIIIIDIIVFIF